MPPGLLVITGDQAFAGNPGLCVDGMSELGGVCNVDGGHKGGLARRSAMLVPVLMAATARRCCSWPASCW